MKICHKCGKEIKDSENESGIVSKDGFKPLCHECFMKTLSTALMNAESKKDRLCPLSSRKCKKEKCMLWLNVGSDQDCSIKIVAKGLTATSVMLAHALSCITSEAKEDSIKKDDKPKGYM